ncbi:MAG: hypothetical protein U9P36_06530 [Thermodesulfobacteriota bacterium]|nr:hypothetical protein [Thermodesulfobacteriota bacterium]
MKKNKTDQNSPYIPEPGEEALAILIKEAGAEARARKKKAMEYHFQKLHAAACDTLASFKRADPA